MKLGERRSSNFIARGVNYFLCADQSPYFLGTEFSSCVTYIRLVETYKIHDKIIPP